MGREPPFEPHWDTGPGPNQPDLTWIIWVVLGVAAVIAIGFAL